MQSRKILAISVLLSFCCSASLSPINSSNQDSIANRYPNDINIENDPEVLFVEKFDSLIPSILTRYTDLKNVEGMVLVSDLPSGSASKSAIKMTNTGGSNDGGHLFKQFPGGFDGTVFLRYYVKYPSVSKGFIHHESIWFGGYNPSVPYPDPRAGTCELGDKRISIAYEPVTADGMDTYLYWGDMKSWNGGKSCYGNDLVNGSPAARKISWDEWTCVELMVKLNDPVTASNGELKIWQDGVLVGHWGPGFPNGHWKADSWYNSPSDPPFPGFRWRSNAALNINYVWIEYFDDKSPDGVSHYIQYANLVMARKYIGPIKK